MKNWSLSKKIWAVLGLLAFAFVGSTYFALTGLTSVKNSLEEITKQDMKRDALTSQIQLNQRGLTLTVLEGVLMKDPENMAKNKVKYKKTLKLMKDSLDNYEKLASPEEKSVLAEYKSFYKKYLKNMDEVRDYSLKNENDKASASYLASEETTNNMRDRVKELNQLTATSLAEKSKAANSTATQAILTGIIVSVTSIFVSMLIAFFVLRAVTSTINEVVKNLFDSSLQVSSAASQIASSSEELSQSATEQAASLEETAASIEEMNSMVSKNSENATSAASTSTKSQEKASQGKSVVEKMIQSMDAINESNNTIMTQVNQSNDNMAGIVKVIEEIGSKTKVINDIVFQTKLLSFNASVEAARAGEHGKGFAVVAEEVGNLAQMSGNAAKEISTMLEDSIQRVNKIVQETKTGVERLIAEGKETVESGSKVAQECGEVLDEIVHNVSSVSSMADEIASASKEQSRGVSEITKAMGQLDQMTQQNASVSEECASSAEELSAQSESLKNAVSQLVVTINGANHKPQDDSHRKNSEPKALNKPKAEKAAGKGPHPSNKVVHLKNSHTASSEPTALKRASGGDTPDYNSQGFEDI